MKRLLLTGLGLCLLAHGATAQGSLEKLDERNGFKGIVLGSLKKLDERNGFKGFVLGDSIKNYESLKYTGNSDDGGDEQYEASGFSKRLGDADVRSLSVSAFEGRITAISASFLGARGHKIKKVLEHAYGPPTEPAKSGNFKDCHWRSDKVRLSLFYAEDDPDGFVVMVFVSREMVDLKMRREEEATRKAVGDL